MRKILAFIVSLVIVFTALPFTAMADECDLPEFTPLIVKEAVLSGKITEEAYTERLELCEALYKGFMNYSQVIDLSPFNIEYTAEEFEILNLCISYVMDMPEMFQVIELFDNNNSSFVISDSEEKQYVKEMRIAYLPNGYASSGEAVFDRELALEKSREYERLIDEILEKVPDGFSDMEKLLFLNDYIAVNYEYKLGGESLIFDSYGFLKEKGGVCDAYSKTYLHLLERLGIPAMRAISNDGNHSWNIVSLDGEYYHIDVTWADPYPDCDGKALHQFFLLSDEALTKADTENHINWYVGESLFGIEDISCSSTKYDKDYLWNNINNPFLYYNGEYYCIDDTSWYEYETLSDGTTVVCDYEISAVIRKTKDFKTYTDVKRLNSAPWFDKNGSGYFVKNYNCGFYMVDSQIYYNDSNRLMYYDVSNGEEGIVFEAVDSNITGFYYAGNGSFKYTEFAVENGLSLFNKMTYELPDMGAAKIGGTASFADDLISIRKYISTGNSSQICLLKGDISENDGKVDIRDLVALKKLALQ